MPAPVSMKTLFFSFVTWLIASATDDVTPSVIMSTWSRSYHCRAMAAPTSGLFWWSAETISTFSPCASGLKSSTASRAATTEPSPLMSE